MHKLWSLVFFVLSTSCETLTEHDFKHSNYTEDGCQTSSSITPEATYITNAQLLQNELVKNTARHKRTAMTITCPQSYELLDDYCVRITASHSWKKAYQECYLQGMEKTPLDSLKVWSNAELLTNIWSKLPRNASSVWLPVEQKQENGPIYYSGPITSDFSYQFNSDKYFNLTWSDTKPQSQTNCLMLDFTKRELALISCYTELSFVCLFPATFWSKGVVLNSFHKHLENNEITWQSAQQQCEDESTGFTLIPEHILNNNSGSNVTKWIGEFNTCLHNMPKYGQVAQVHNRIWFGMNISTIYNTVDNIKSCNGNDTYYCLDRAINIIPRILLTKTNASFPIVYNIKLENVDKINSIYDIKCYLNGEQLIVKQSSISASHPGKLFCEVLTFPPISMLKSNTEIVKYSSPTTFILEVYDQNANFSSKWLYNGYDDDTKSTYIDPLYSYIQNNFRNISISVQRISAQKNEGIAVTFLIQIPLNSNAGQQQLLKNYSLQLQRLFPIGKTLPLTMSTNIMVKSLTNTEYCLEYFTNVNYTNCTSQIVKWPMTLGSQSAISTPACTICSEDKILKRSCIKHEFSGANWSTETLESFKSPKCFAEKAVYVLKHENVRNKISELINEFDDLFRNKTEETQQTNTYSNLTVSSVRTSLNSLHGFKYYNNQNETTFSIIRNNTPDANGSMPDIVVLFTNETFSDSAVLHSLSEAYITVAVIKGLFPSSENLAVASPIVHMHWNTTIVADNFSAYIKVNHTESPQDYTCGHWDYNNSEWSTENNIYMGYDANGYHHCVFSHISSFALLFKVKPTVSLSIISLIGCILSILGLSMLIFSYVFFSKKQKDNYARELLFNLAVSLVCMYLIFMVGFHQVHAETWCIISGALLHYFTLASFCWMMVKAYDAYLKYVRVLGSYISRFLLKASVIAWGIPAIPVVSVAIADYKLFRDDHSCHIRSYGFYYAFLLPISVIVTINMCIFLVILINVFCRRAKLRIHQQKNKLLWLEVKMSISIFILFGLTWIFGFLAIVDSSSVCSYLFCITTPLQGFFMFFLYVIVNKNIQNGWKRICCKKLTEIDENNSSGTLALM